MGSLGLISDLWEHVPVAALIYDDIIVAKGLTD